MGDNDEYHLSLIVCDAETGKMVTRIKTGLKYSLFQIELAKFGMRRLGKTDWRKNLCLTRDRITLLYSDKSSAGSSLKIWSHRFSADDGENIELKDPLVDEVLADSEKEAISAKDLKTCVEHNEDKIIICYQDPARKETVLNVYDGKSGEMVINVDWPEEELVLVGVKGNRALLVNSSANQVCFFSTDSGETITRIPFSDLNEGSQSYGPWTGLFDSGPGVHEFALFRSDNSDFKLYSYDPGNEMAPPVLELETITDTYKLTSECLTTAKLKNGVIFFNRKVYLPYGFDELDCYHEVSALSLRAQSCYPIITMCSGELYLEETKYNELSLKHFDPKNKFSDFNSSTVVETFDPAKRPLFFINPNTFGIFMELGNVIRVFNFDHDERTVLETEVRDNEERERIKQEELLAQQEKEKKAKEKRERMLVRRKEAEDEFVGKEEKVRGKVDEWRGTYGFIRCSISATYIYRFRTK